jgi:hypothetical protein
MDHFWGWMFWEGLFELIRGVGTFQALKIEGFFLPNLGIEYQQVFKLMNRWIEFFVENHAKFDNFWPKT